jgi:hypothetical protein
MISARQKAGINQREDRTMGVFVLVVAAMIWGSTVGFEADQGNPETKNLVTSIYRRQ